MATLLASAAGPATGAGADCRASDDCWAALAIWLLSASGVAEPPVGAAGLSLG